MGLESCGEDGWLAFTSALDWELGYRCGIGSLEPTYEQKKKYVR